MADIESIIAMVLSNIIEAQNAANQVSKDISAAYLKDKTLRYFPVPNALLDEVDMTLNFTIDSVEARAESGPGVGRRDTVALPRVVSADIATEVAILVLADLGRRIEVARVEGAGGVAVALRRHLWAPTVRRPLTQNLTSALHPILMLYSVEAREGGERGDRDEEARRALVDGLVSTFDGDLDLAATVGPVEAWASQMAEGQIGDHLAAALAEAVAAHRGDAGRAAMPISIRVGLGPSQDQNPEYLVQTMRLHAKMRNYKWVIVEGESSEDTQLLPES